MGRFREFSKKELDILEAALCQEGIGYLVDEVRMERERKEGAEGRMWEVELRVHEGEGWQAVERW